MVCIFKLCCEITSNPFKWLEINKRHKMAQYSSRASVSLYTIIFFKNKRERHIGYITRIKANGFSVIVPKYGVEGLVYLESEEGGSPSFIFDENTLTLTSSTNPQLQLCVFAQVLVEVSVDEEKQRMKLEWIREPSPSSNKHSLPQTPNKSSASPSKKQKK